MRPLHHRRPPLRIAGYTNTLAAELTRNALLRNWKIADGYGWFDAGPGFQVSAFRISAFSIIGSRQVQKAQELFRAGLLSKEGFAKVRSS